MSAAARSQTNPYRLYVFGLGFGGSLLMAIVNTTSALYWVTAGHLNALELLLLGTALEITYFTFQLPTGVLADLVSRRLCVIVGWFTTGTAFVLQGSIAGLSQPPGSAGDLRHRCGADDRRRGGLDRRRARRRRDDIGLRSRDAVRPRRGSHRRAGQRRTRLPRAECSDARRSGRHDRAGRVPRGRDAGELLPSRCASVDRVRSSAEPVEPLPPRREQRGARSSRSPASFCCSP